MCLMADHMYLTYILTWRATLALKTIDEIIHGRDSLYNKGTIFSFNLVITFL
jgi:hypothetical protein